MSRLRLRTTPCFDVFVTTELSRAGTPAVSLDATCLARAAFGSRPGPLSRSVRRALLSPPRGSPLLEITQRVSRPSRAVLPTWPPSSPVKDCGEGSAGVPARRLSLSRPAMRHREGLARGETWVRCLALLGAEALRINRSLYGQCRAARAVFTRAEARRARSPWPFGRSGVELRFRVGAVPAVTPVLFDQRLQPTIRLIKNGHSPCLGPLRAASHAGGSPRIHAERLVEAVSVPWRRRFFLIPGVERTSGASSSKPRLQHTTCVACNARCALPRDPGPPAERCPPASARAPRCDIVTRETAGRDPSIEAGSPGTA